MNLKKRSFLETKIHSIGQILANFIFVAEKAAYILNTDGQISLIFCRNLLRRMVYHISDNELLASLLFGADGFLNFDKNNIKQFLAIGRAKKFNNAAADNFYFAFFR